MGEDNEGLRNVQRFRLRNSSDATIKQILREVKDQAGNWSVVASTALGLPPGLTVEDPNPTLTSGIVEVKVTVDAEYGGNTTQHSGSIPGVSLQPNGDYGPWDVDVTGTGGSYTVSSELVVVHKH